MSQKDTLRKILQDVTKVRRDEKFPDTYYLEARLETAAKALSELITPNPDVRVYPSGFRWDCPSCEWINTDAPYVLESEDPEIVCVNCKLVVNKITPTLKEK